MRRLFLIIILAIAVLITDSQIDASTQFDPKAVNAIEHSRSITSSLDEIWSG